ncbi:response regulator transcription factor [bacterium]|nr:response regulator transcription factor [bacterium]
MNRTVLIIDDDQKLNHLLKTYLSKYGFSVQTAVHPVEGLKKLHHQTPDIIILDVMLPDQNGFDVCKTIRQQHSTPVIMLTARGEVTDRVLGLELGADDYLPKPFEPRELVARMQSILRRGHHSRSTELLKTRHLTLDLNRHEARLGKKILDLSTMEFEILKLFAQNPGRVYSRDQLLDHIRGIEWEAYNRSIDVLISRLRQKLADDPKQPKFIKTVRGTGYMLIDEAV